MNLATVVSKLQLLAKIAVHVVFWPWNLLFLCLLTMGYVPLALIDLVIDAVDGLARWDFVIGSLVIVALPIVITVQSVRRLRKSAVDLAIVFFGVELPVLVFVCGRLFGCQDLSGAAYVVLFCVVVGGTAALLRACFPMWSSTKWTSLALHPALALFLVAGTYLAFLVDLLLVPAGLAAVKQSVENLITYGVTLPSIHLADLVAMTAAVIPAAWGLLTMAVLLALPFVAPLVWLRQLAQSSRVVANHFGGAAAVVAGGVPVAVAVVCFFVFLPTPFATIQQQLDDANSDDERAAVIADLADVDRVLVDAYLHHHRYLDDSEHFAERNPWRETWAHVVGDNGGASFGEFAGALARPFIFQGEYLDDKAAEAYWRALHGTHIERDNADAVVDALSATWSREERYAGFINEGQQKVRLVRQDVVVTVDGGVAHVEVHDEWSNLTVNDEEVALFFELPETAAVTGLRLSPDGDRNNAFVGVVAPRGAAQQVYKEQVARRRDPALLEQVGPRQYRLRVFPVPARHIDRDRGFFGLWQGADAWNNVKDQPRQHVWFSYDALVEGGVGGVDDGGHVPLPQLREARNGFWDKDTVRVVDGRDLSGDDARDGWVRGAVNGKANDVVDGCAGDHCYRFATSAPAAATLTGAVDVVVDRSWSTRVHAAAIEEAVRALTKGGAQVRLVLGTSALRHAPVDVIANATAEQAAHLTHYGAASPKELITQYLGAVRDPAPRLVVLTGQGSFDVADDAPFPKDTVLPQTLIVHLGGAFPAGYDDVTFDAVRRSNGSAVASIDEAIARLAGNVYVDGRMILGLPSSSSSSTSKAASALAARQAVLDADRGGKADPATLDPLHQVAKQHGIVTPYSSLIALVDEAQRQRLKQLEEQEDRFDREVENGAKVAAAPDVSGVPEPHEWLLLLLAFAAVAVLSRKTLSSSLSSTLRPS